MEFTINSKKLNKSVTFSRPGSGYIYVNLNGRSGTLGNQICSGGSLSGNTLGYSGDSKEVFSRICKNWYTSLLKNSDHLDCYGEL